MRELEGFGRYVSLYCQPNIEHGIRNVGNIEAKYLVVKKRERKWAPVGNRLN